MGQKYKLKSGEKPIDRGWDWVTNEWGVETAVETPQTIVPVVEVITNGEPTMSSREIAELTEKEHRNVLADCDNLNENYEKLGLLKIQQSSFINEQNRSFRELLLTKMQTFDLLTGYSAELRIKVNRRWEELEKKEQQFAIPQTYSEALQLAANQAKQIELQAAQLVEVNRVIEEQAPKVDFAETVTANDNAISIGEFANQIL